MESPTVIDTEIVHADPNMPKVIPGVWIGLLTATMGLAASFGLELTQAQQIAVIGFATSLGAVIPIVDAWLRRARLVYLADVSRARESAIARQAFHGRLLELKDRGEA